MARSAGLDPRRATNHRTFKFRYSDGRKGVYHRRLLWYVASSNSFIKTGEGMAKAVGATKYLVEMITGRISEAEYLKPFLLSRFK